MNRLVPCLLTALLIPASSLLAERLLLEENFNSYPEGELSGEEWPSNLSGTAVRWQFGRGTVQQRITTHEGAEGHVLSVTENAPEHVVNYSVLQLPELPEPNAQWKLSFRFFIESLESPAVFGLIGLYEGEVSTEAQRSAGRVTSLVVSRNSRTGDIQAAAAREGGVTFFSERLSPQKWYTVEITGNLSDQTFSILIRDDTSQVAQLSDLQFSTTVNRFDHLVIGDSYGNQWEDERHNTILFDDLKLTEL